MKAIWNGQVIAESDRTIEVEGNHYFPPSSVNDEYLVESPKTNSRSLEGEIRYYTLRVEGLENENAAWFYPDPEGVTRDVKGMVTFSDDVEVRE